MIDFVSGKLASKKPTEVVIAVSGIGYRLLIPTSTFEQLPDLGKTTELLCHHYVREDAILLFGFYTDAERSIFNLLLGVSGVGPKLALAALSALRPDEIQDRIVSGDAAMLTRIPGVGRKTAERLIVDLRDKFEKMSFAEHGASVGDSSASARSDAIAALEALGLSRVAADRSLRDVIRKHPDVEAAEELIRLALRQ